MEEILHLGCIITVNTGIFTISTGAGFQPSTSTTNHELNLQIRQQNMSPLMSIGRSGSISKHAVLTGLAEIPNCFAQKESAGFHSSANFNYWDSTSFMASTKWPLSDSEKRFESSLLASCPCNQWLLVLPACGDTGGVTSTDSCNNVILSNLDSASSSGFKVLSNIGLNGLRCEKDVKTTNPGQDWK